MEQIISRVIALPRVREEREGMHAGGILYPWLEPQVDFQPKCDRWGILFVCALLFV